ncbi:hypothetical protein ARMGADRAFT_871587, partial [Armillaria gallica]
TRDKIMMQMVYTGQQHLNGYTQAVNCGEKRKETFDKKVVGSKLRNVVFREGELVQVFNMQLDKMMQTKKKPLPRWSGVLRI